MNKILALTFLLATPLFWAADKPNILFFLVDDMGLGDTSVPFLYKDGEAQKIPLNGLYRTPNMEKLAALGRRFSQAYSYSVCSPTRITLMTGQAAPRHRVTTWTHPASSGIDTGFVKTNGIQSPPHWAIAGIDRNLPLLPALLKETGYRTLFAGKAHFGPDDTPSGDPANLGFDVSIAGFGGGGPGSYWGMKNYSAVWRKGPAYWNIPGLQKYHGTDTFLTEALTLEMNAAITNAVAMKKPFFAYMSHYAVHAPYETDKRFVANYPKLTKHALAYATLVEGMDKSLGDMISHLEQLNVAEETLIIFFSDNGSTLNTGAPFRDKKGSRYEGAFRVPMIVSWAKSNPDNPLQKNFAIPANSVEHDMVTCEDVMPTVLKIAGASVPAGTVIDGFDVSPYFRGEEGTHRPQEFLSHFPHKHRNTLFSTYRQKDWKIIYNYGPQTWELYNLATDPFEKSNVAKSKPEFARTMAKKMIQKLDGYDAQYPVDLKSNQPAKPDLDKL